ncbi:MAG: PIN domain-containing protein [Actinomycetota bacterium]|nr:PIN domain-containing protein [Actinomycetota bacterium]
MALLVDTSVWSLLLRRHSPPDLPEVTALRRALGGDELAATTGVVVQELLHGSVSASAQAAMTETFGALEYLAPTFDDHVEAAGVRKHLRSSGIQLGAIDALIAQLAIAGGHTLLTTDDDFNLVARLVGLQVWRPLPGGTPE